jgi:hypothetical protein
MNLIWTSKFKFSFRGLEQFIYKLIIEDIYEISQVVFNFYIIKDLIVCAKTGLQMVLYSHTVFASRTVFNREKAHCS